MALLAASALAVSFGGIRALDGVDFTVPYFLTQFAAGVPGPSGLACAGMGVPCL